MSIQFPLSQDLRLFSICIFDVEDFAVALIILPLVVVAVVAVATAVAAVVARYSTSDRENFSFRKTLIE